MSQAKKLDDDNCNALLMGTMSRYVDTLKVVFNILEDGSKTPVSCNADSGHLVFNACINLECKHRWVKDGCRTPEHE